MNFDDKVEENQRVSSDHNLISLVIFIEYPVMELSHGHYGLVTVQNSAGMIGLCHPPAIDCSNSATWSPIATAICRKLGEYRVVGGYLKICLA